MKKQLVVSGLALVWASAATAHPGAHVHPHDGAHWLVMVGALAVMAVAARLAVARNRRRK